MTKLLLEKFQAAVLAISRTESSELQELAQAHDKDPCGQVIRTSALGQMCAKAVTNWGPMVLRYGS